MRQRAGELPWWRGRTGEGDAYGTRAPDSPQNFVSVGAGTAGMGISIAYARASIDQAQFDPAKYADAELTAQIAEQRRATACA